MKVICVLRAFARQLRTSLRTKLIVSIALVSMTMAAIFSYYYFGVYAAAQEQAMKSFDRISTASEEQLLHLLDESQEAAQIVAYSSAVQRFLLATSAQVVIPARTDATDIMGYFFCTLDI